MGLLKILIIRSPPAFFKLVLSFRLSFFSICLLLICSTSFGKDLTLNEYLSQVKQTNPLRTETAVQAKEIDQKIAEAWVRHPNYEVIESTENFLAKAQSALKMITKHIPDCCQAGLKDVADEKIL